MWSRPEAASAWSSVAVTSRVARYELEIVRKKHNTVGVTSRAKRDPAKFLNYSV